VVLDGIRLSSAFRRIKTNKLVIPEDEQQTDDMVRLRKDVYSYLRDITDRLDGVAKEEVLIARRKIQIIYDYFEENIIEEAVITELVSRVKLFYEEINKTQINIPVVSTDRVNKTAIQIEKALHDISEVLDEDDLLSTIMTFSGDPVSTLNPLIELLEQLDKDVAKVEKEIAKRKLTVSDPADETDVLNRYQLELKSIDDDIDMMRGEEVNA